MKKKFLTLLLALIFPLCGCGNDDSSKQGSSFYYEYTDVSGVKTSFSEKPKNVAVLFSSFAEVWNNTGGVTKITVGDSVKRGFVNSEDVTLVNESSGMKIDQETLIAANPDLVIGSYDLTAQVKAVNFCRESNIKSILFHEESFDNYLEMLNVFSSINQNTTSYHEQGELVEERIEVIKNKPRGTTLKYLFIRGGVAFNSTEMKRASTHFACKIFDDLGAKNILDDYTLVNENLSLETILLNQPDIILVVPKGDLTQSREYIESVFAQDGWKDLDAIKNNKVTYLDKDLFGYKPNAKWDQSYSEAYNILYEA